MLDEESLVSFLLHPDTAVVIEIPVTGMIDKHVRGCTLFFSVRKNSLDMAELEAQKCMCGYVENINKNLWA